MQISSLSLLKLGRIATITSLDIKNKNIANKLCAVGFCPGRDIVLLNNSKGLFIAKVAQDNPFCFREDLADLIKIQSDSSNFHRSIKERNQENSIIFAIKKFLKRIKK